MVSAFKKAVLTIPDGINEAQMYEGKNFKATAVTGHKNRNVFKINSVGAAMKIGGQACVQSIGGGVYLTASGLQ